MLTYALGCIGGPHAPLQWHTSRLRWRCYPKRMLTYADVCCRMLTYAAACSLAVAYFRATLALLPEAAASIAPHSLGALFTSAYVSIRSIRQHTQHTSAFATASLASRSLGTHFTCVSGTKVALLVQNCRH